MVDSLSGASREPEDVRRLHCYQLAVTISRWVRKAEFPAGDSKLKDQARRAADSIPLNIAEGTRSAGKNRKRHFRYAEGSAAEACAVLDLVELDGGAAIQVELRRVAAMVGGLR